MKIKYLFSTLLLAFSSSILAEGIDDKVNEVVGPYLNGFTNLIFMQIPFILNSLTCVHSNMASR